MTRPRFRDSWIRRHPVAALSLFIPWLAIWLSFAGLADAQWTRLDEHRFPWAYAESGRPTLTGVWAGRLTTSQSNRRGMLLDLQLRTATDPRRTIIQVRHAFLETRAMQKSMRMLTGIAAGATLLAASTTNVDPCTFFTKAELESAVGYPLGPAKPVRGEPTCRFPNPTRGTVTVRAGDLVTPAQFDSLKLYTGPDIEPVRGIGDKAFLWGARIYALSGNRQLMINLDKHELTPDVRKALTSLAKLGVPRLK